MPRTIVITGASRGLGLALVKAFLVRGDQVIAISKTKKYWKQAQRSLPEGKVEFFNLDLTLVSHIKKASKTIFKRYPHIDILINNAGVGGRLSTIEDTTPREYQNMMNGNLLSAFLFSQILIPKFQKQKKGLIINISSMAGTRAVPRLFAYSASKFGMLALSQCIAKENPDTIKSFTVCPGGMDTLMRESLFGQEDSRRQQSPEFVANIILKTISGEIAVESGGDIVIRHGKVTAIHPCPSA